MFNFLFGTKEKNKYNKQISQINFYYDQYKFFSKKDIFKKSNELKKSAKSDMNDSILLFQAFALAKVAAEQSIGLKAYDVQLYGGLVLNEGKIAEMKTGEGKTSVAVFPAYYNALINDTAIIITVNDYLAKRDANQMGKVFETLGLTTGVIQHEMTIEERKEQYTKDIVYVTNKEFGFDYLKDNMAYSASSCMLPEFNFILIDEVDSVLIDEARTPLIISSPLSIKSEDFVKCIDFLNTCEIGKLTDLDEGLAKVSKLIVGEGYEESGDVIADGEYKRVYLSEKGIAKAEKYFNIKNWASIDNLDLRSVMQQCLLAMYIIKEDKDYILAPYEDTFKIQLIDTFNGRISEGKEYSHGLQQALQAKHGLTITPQSAAVAQITYPNLFKMAHKLAGMTGTAVTEKTEFYTLYGLEIVVVPTNKPLIRKDRDDRFFFTKEEKYAALLKTVEEAVSIQRPVLIGTPDIEENEFIANKLKSLGIQCEILNAKSVEKEAEIIAKAGQKGSVTVATNMAGRGTDILIDDYTRSVGGLLIIGVERHESRRIDNQLCGRAGRQGDPGETMFFISLEDEILKYFSVPPIINKMKEQLDHSVEISLPIMSSIIDKAQHKIEGQNYKRRENLMKDDNVINQQRNIIYEDRNKILKEKDIFSMLNGYVHSLYEENKINEEDKKNILKKFSEFKELNTENKEDVIKEHILKRIDKEWAEYLEEIENIQSQLVFTSMMGGASEFDFIFKSGEAFDILVETIQEGIIATINSLSKDDFKEKSIENS